jgi:hypothetical protein
MEPMSVGPPAAALLPKSAVNNCPPTPPLVLGLVAGFIASKIVDRAGKGLILN